MTTQKLKTGKGVALPSRYAQLRGARETAFDPPPLSKLRHLWVGEVGEGKTTGCCSIPKCAILDIEHKTSGILRLAPGSLILGNGGRGESPWTLKEYWDFLTMMAEDGRHGRAPFDVVAFDTLGGLCQLVLQEFTEANNMRDDDQPWRDFAQYGSDGAGYGRMNSWINSKFYGLSNAGIGLVVTAHKIVKEKEDSNGNVLATVKVDGNPGVVAALDRMCEFSGTISRTRRTRTVKKEIMVAGQKKMKTGIEEQWVHILDLETRPAADSGPRATTRQHVPLPEGEIVHEEGYLWDAMEAAYKTACENRRKEIEELS